VNASIAVELLTRRGWRLPGFTREGCERVRPGVDGTAVEVREAVSHGR
jgi:hypothetical protein